MRPRDEKAVITKAIRRYVREKFLLKKICGDLNNGDSYEAIVTPNSDKVFLQITCPSGKLLNQRASVPRFSDYLVVNGGFTYFISNFKELYEEVPE